jgi:hypothetical protein
MGMEKIIIKRELVRIWKEDVFEGKILKDVSRA